jgi:hypothetical protein
VVGKADGPRVPLGIWQLAQARRGGGSRAAPVWWSGARAKSPEGKGHHPARRVRPWPSGWWVGRLTVEASGKGRNISAVRKTRFSFRPQPAAIPSYNKAIYSSQERFE